MRSPPLGEAVDHHLSQLAGHLELLVVILGHEVQRDVDLVTIVKNRDLMNLGPIRGIADALNGLELLGAELEERACLVLVREGEDSALTPSVMPSSSYRQP